MDVSRRQWLRRAGLVVLTVALVFVTGKAVSAFRGASRTEALPPIPPAGEPGEAIVSTPASELPVADSILGRSHVLRFKTLTPAKAVAIPGFIRLLGEPGLEQALITQLSRD